MSEEMGRAKIPWHIKWQGLILRTAGLAVIKLVYRIRRVNPAALPKTGGVLLLPNHVTFADAFFISGACSREVRFVMDDAFMANPVIRWFCTIFNTVTIRRGQSREAIKITIDALNHGDVVCFFPEGQLSRTGTLSELRRGVELIARKANAAIVPLWIDGAWGSIFSYEHNVFFKKTPHRLPHPIIAAFGQAMTPAEVTLESVRTGILKASADALSARFPGENPLTINGYQIGQLNGIVWRTPFAALKSDPLVKELPTLFERFAGEFGSYLQLLDAPDAGPRSWVGGEKLRQALAESPAGNEIDFYDFSDLALTVFEKSGVHHLPCLAIDGRVVAMSVNDPSQPHKGSEFQAGKKAGTWGKLLPGWYIEGGRVMGPAAGPAGLPLPAGAFLDIEGFVAAG